MKEQIYAYDDHLKLFLEKNLRKVKYMESLDSDIFHEVMFNFKQETFEKGAFLFKEKDLSNAMFLIKSGIVEITCKVEAHDLVIERLYRGSIINHRSFLLADVIDINARCASTVTLFYLTYD
jgi:CRP-like cAMP-binding protein